MAVKSRYLTAVLVCTAAAAMIAAEPIAAADTPLPEPGSENAADTISDLESRGYDVQINWVSGIPRVSLDQCWVNGINTAAAGAGGLQTAYVDIECPK